MHCDCPQSVRNRPALTLLVTCISGVLALGGGDPSEALAPVGPPAPALAPPGGVLPDPALLPEVRFEVSAQWVTEQVGEAHVAIKLSAPSNGPVRVPFTVGGSAVRGQDFALNLHPLVIPEGATSADLVVRVFDDGLDEADETVLLTLSEPRGARLGGHASHTLAIGQTALGGPREGLTPDELAAFEAGKILFEKRFTPSEGLGPFYNATSCKSCHSTPVTGGTAALYRNFYLAVYQFGPTPISQSTSIPPFLSQVVPAFGSGELHIDAQFTLTGGRPLIPETVFGFPVVSAQRNSIPIFGVGMFEKIGNADISANADPDDLDGDGISGRINTALGGTAVGRLGLKSQSNNIELFTRAPLQNQMGITSNPFDGAGGIVSLSALQVSGDPNEPTVDGDGVPDPEISTDDLGDLIAFTRFLAPPEPKPFSPDALAGQDLFGQIGCASCHVPSMPSSIGPVNAYSDLLIHDMGPDLVDNIKLGESPGAPFEFRTQPLWGISLMAPYLHDGRAPTLPSAIELHAGEAQASRDLFMALTETEQDQLIIFLEHL